GGIVGSDWLAAEAAEKLLHRPVFERMEADHGEHAAGGEPLEGRGQRTFDGADLVVHGNADALEAAGGGMNPALAALGSRDGVGNDAGQRAGAGEVAGAAGGDERAHHAAPGGLFAEVAN